MDDFTITRGYMRGIAVAEDSESATLELHGRALTLAKPDVQLIGTVLALDDDSLTLAVKRHAAPIVIPRDAIVKLDTPSGRRGHAKRGAIIGGTVGLAMTFLGCAALHDFGGCSWPDDIGPGAKLVSISAGLGALIGAAIRSDKWAVVPMRSKAGSRVEPRAGVNLSVAFRF